MANMITRVQEKRGIYEAFYHNEIFAFLGILGEYIGKVFVEVKRRPKYVVDRIEK